MRAPTPLYDRISNPDLVYKTGAWDRYQWRSVSSALPDAAQVLATGTARTEDFDAFPREAFARLYSEAARLDEPGAGAEWATRMHDAMDALPEWQRMRDTVRGDAFLAGVAAVSMAEHLLGDLPTPAQQAPSFARARSVARAAARMGCGEQEAQECLARAENEASALEMPEQETRIAVRAAIESAAKAVEEAAKAQAVFGLGAGSGAGSDGTGSPMLQKARLRDAMKRSDKVRKIADLAGKMVSIAAQKRASRVRPQREEIVDVVCGDDIDRALPGQLALLATDAGRAEFARLLCGGELQCYEYDASEPKGRGPMVLCVDNSGSMSGFPECWSKALAFGLAEIAAKDKRDVVMVHFDGRVQRVARWTRGAIDAATALDMIEFFSGGGTEFEPPLREAVSQIAGGLDGADVVFITDGYGRVSAGFEAEWAAVRKSQKVVGYGILIGYDHCDDTMRRLFDRTWAVDERKLDGMEDGLLEEIAARSA
jgi:uncharacterized protein with von Willebrand factor type A (vWA) domain